jgi:Cdc6-like AAA superfamily ATPase
MSVDIFQHKAFEVSRVFTPTAPVDEAALFSGRHAQLRAVIDAVNQKGQHAILYGERGVGKTSLANVLTNFLEGFGVTVAATRVNCDTDDTFETLFDKAFRDLQLVYNKPSLGFQPGGEKEVRDARALLDGAYSPDNVRRALSIISNYMVPVIILDEFDRLPEATKRNVADAVKSLSDHGVGATIIMVGVADTIGELIAEHASIERAMVQVHMPRMSSQEIAEIIDKGLNRLGMTVDDDAAQVVVELSQGLPHYTHHICLHASRAALEEEKTNVERSHVDKAIDRAVQSAQQSIQSMYHQATMSPRKDNLFADVLLACALANVDQMGYFAAQDVRDPMKDITGKNYDIPSFAQHLNEFTEDKRGPILKKIGTPRRYRFRFINPLMQPYVIMQGCQKGKIKV